MISGGNATPVPFQQGEVLRLAQTDSTDRQQAALAFVEHSMYDAMPTSSTGVNPYANTWPTRIRGTSLASPYQRGNARGGNAPPPPNSNYNAIELMTTATGDDVFDRYIKTFAGVTNGTYASVQGPPVTTVGQTLTFTLTAPGVGVFQGPFSVTVTCLDAASHTIAVETGADHPLSGWRYWRVFQRAPGRLVVETGAVDGPSPGLKNFAGFWFDRMYTQNMTGIWREYLDYIRVQLGATQVSEPPYDQSLVNG